MQYLLLIHDREADEAALTPEQTTSILTEYRKFHTDVEKSGKYVGSNRLRPTSTATTVRVRGGKMQTTDGPFAETREQLAGYYLVDAADLDDAVRLASKIPSAKSGSIEVRPIWPMTEM